MSDVEELKERVRCLEAVINYVYMVSDDIVTSEMVRRLHSIGFDPRDQYRKAPQCDALVGNSVDQEL